MQQVTSGTINLWREYCPTLHSRCGNFLPDHLIPQAAQRRDPGYSSHYMFLEPDALHQRQVESSRGLGRHTVAGNYLIIDLDDGEVWLWRAMRKLLDLGLGFDVWFSGSKGYHIYIFHELIVDWRLPYSHQCFVKGLGIDCDLSLYHPARIVSLPGRIHPKTGSPKRLLFSFEGNMAEIAIKEPPEKPVFDFDTQAEECKLRSGLLRLHDLILCKPKPGNRHTQLWSVSMTLLEAGLNPDTVLELITQVNNTWDQPKPPEELEVVVAQACRQAQRTSGY